MIVMTILLVVCFAGCEKITLYQKDGTSLTETQYQELEPEDQVGYVPIEAKVISEKAKGQIDAVGGVAEVGVTVVESIWPTAGGIAGTLVAGLLALWQAKKGTVIKGKYDAVKAGALITAATIEKVVKPVAETWDKFKEEQKDAELKAKGNGGVIMPDKIL